MVKIFRTKKRLKLEENISAIEKAISELKKQMDYLLKLHTDEALNSSAQFLSDLSKRIDEMQLTLDNLTDENTTSKTAQQLLNEYFYGEQK